MNATATVQIQHQLKLAPAKVRVMRVAGGRGELIFEKGFFPTRFRDLSTVPAKDYELGSPFPMQSGQRTPNVKGCLNRLVAVPGLGVMHFIHHSAPRE